MDSAATIPGWRNLALHKLSSSIGGAALAAVAIAFFYPWLLTSEPGSSAMRRYSPLNDGKSTFAVEYGSDGQQKSWSSENVRFVPPALALTSELRVAHREALIKFLRSRAPSPTNDFTGLDQLASDGEVYSVHSRSRPKVGEVSDETHCWLRTDSGDYLIGTYSRLHDLDLVFDPPLRVLAGSITVGERWHQRGQRIVGGQSFDYQYDVHILGRESLRNEAGFFADCIKVDTRLTTSTSSQEPSVHHAVHFYAAGSGLVEWQSFDGAGKLKERSVTLTAAGLENRSLLPPLAQVNPITASSKPAATNWKLTRLSAIRSGTDFSSATFAPVWIPAKEPLLLAAKQSGDLTAITLESGIPNVAWRFHPAGTILGTPCWDAARSQIYFGATDKRLYAVDVHGMFRWLFLAGDNIASRPAIFGDTVVFGSEDRCIYALDADTGVLRWKYRTGGAVASSPAAVAGLAVVGSDDGRLYAFDPKKGQLKWTYAVGSPIDTPVVADGTQVFVVARDGQLHAVDGFTGIGLWKTYADVKVDSAPAVIKTRVFVIENGCLTTIDRSTGRRLQRTRDHGFLGSPALHEQSLILTGRREVQRFSFEGKPLEQWTVTEPISRLEQGAAFRFGVAEGGGSLWLTDTRGVIWRLGPISEGPVALLPAWNKPLGREPFGFNYLNITPAAFGEHMVLLSSAREIFLVEAATGKAKKAGSFGKSGTVTVEPLVVGDLLLASVGSTLHAITLPDGEPLWEFDGAGSPLRPPSIANDTVYWLVQGEQTDKTEVADDSAPRVLYSVDLTTGELRWERTIDTGNAAGGSVVLDGSVLLSTPPSAFDAITGESIWSAKIKGVPLGGPAIDSASNTLFVGLTDRRTGAGYMAAIDTTDGTVHWEQSLEAGTLHPGERPWLEKQILIVPLWSGEIAAIDARSGAHLWRYKPSVARMGAITVAAGRVWFMQQDCQVVGLDSQNGTPTQHFGLDIDLSSFTCFSPRPIVIGERVFAPLTLMILGLELPKGPITQ